MNIHSGSENEGEMAMTTQTILITGATAGIGRFAALYLARKGHRVFASGRNEAALAKLRADAAGFPLETVRLDVTDAKSIEAAAAEILRRTNGRGIDALVNNAGWGMAGPLAEIPVADLREQFETNVFGLHAVTRAFLPQLRANAASGGRGPDELSSAGRGATAPRRSNGRTRILNVSSMGGRMTFPFFGAYHATKYAVEAMSDALRNELSPLGIDVVLIEPGVIKSDFSDRSRASIEKYRRDDSPYAPIYARADAIQAQSDRQAVEPDVIARAMERAITARRPRARYVAPARTYLALMFFRFFPTRWVDGIMRAFLGLRPNKLKLIGSSLDSSRHAA
jgi:NAD(P)-dependent dehydrogenase (short-subunit alcohol dehydrogenase family)